MNPLGYLKLAGALGVVIALLIGAHVINGWRKDAATLPAVRRDFTQYQADTEHNNQERDRRERIDTEISKSYLAVMARQDVDLRAAHDRMAGLRLHIGACKAVPAAVAGGDSTAGAPAESADRKLDVVASEIGDRLAACDRVGARLNALIDWQAAVQESPR